jgi:hypothetical protein
LFAKSTIFLYACSGSLVTFYAFHFFDRAGWLSQTEKAHLTCWKGQTWMKERDAVQAPILAQALAPTERQRFAPSYTHKPAKTN